jgi:hypothetical protein
MGALGEESFFGASNLGYLTTGATFLVFFSDF